MWDNYCLLEAYKRTGRLHNKKFANATLRHIQNTFAEDYLQEVYWLFESSKEYGACTWPEFYERWEAIRITSCEN
jgi:hypothetical protein